MRAIFYDLETSDKEPIGQILNYSFLAVDKSYNLLSELSGDIKISRLQLPNPEAVLANKVNVLEQQKIAEDRESQALLKIWEFLSNVAKGRSQPLALIGYNSARFDLPFLRTSLIRNGLNPYAWKKGIVDRDLLLVIRKLSCSHQRFPRVASKEQSNETGPKLSLKLETLSQHFGILDGAQTHHSRADPLLCIKLSEIILDQYGLDVCTYNPYEGADFESMQRQTKILWAVQPNYDLSKSDIAVEVPYTLLCANQSYALWVNLESYKLGLGKQSIYAIKKRGGSFFVSTKQVESKDYCELAKRAQEEFAEINLNNYFDQPACDIEQFIYRLDFSAREALSEAIWQGRSESLANLKDQDAKVLLLRHKLANYEWGQSADSEMKGYLAQYALRRYGGGKVVLSKSVKLGQEQLLHPTFSELMQRIEVYLKDQSLSAEDRSLMQNLKKFYLESDIFSVAGQKLFSQSPARNSSRLFNYCSMIK